uniref:Uncharacterized protein n=1 Tax=Solanum tuberosum TaxID=4113 RepID=M1DEC1_SOLTU
MHPYLFRKCFRFSRQGVELKSLSMPRKGPDPWQSYSRPGAKWCTTVKLSCQVVGEASQCTSPIRADEVVCPLVNNSS